MYKVKKQKFRFLKKFSWKIKGRNSVDYEDFEPTFFLKTCHIPILSEKYCFEIFQYMGLFQGMCKHQRCVFLSILRKTRLKITFYSLHLVINGQKNIFKKRILMLEPWFFFYIKLLNLGYKIVSITKNLGVFFCLKKKEKKGHNPEDCRFLLADFFLGRPETLPFQKNLVATVTRGGEVPSHRPMVYYKMYIITMHLNKQYWTS